MKPASSAIRSVFAWFAYFAVPTTLSGLILVGVAIAAAAQGGATGRIVLEPEAGTMQVRARVPTVGNPVFALGIPETIGCREALLVMSKQGRPFRMSETTRVKGHMPTVGFYLPEQVAAGTESVFVRGFGATSPDRTDGSWIVTLSEPAGSYMAATAVATAFLFDNLDRCCLHAAQGRVHPRSDPPAIRDPWPGPARKSLAETGRETRERNRCSTGGKGDASAGPTRRAAAPVKSTANRTMAEALAPREFERVAPVSDHDRPLLDRDGHAPAQGAPMQ